MHYGLRVDQANNAKNELAKHFRNAFDEDQDERLQAAMNPVRTLFRRLKTEATATEPEKSMLGQLADLREEVRALAGSMGYASHRLETSPNRERVATILRHLDMSSNPDLALLAEWIDLDLLTRDQRIDYARTLDRVAQDCGEDTALAVLMAAYELASLAIRWKKENELRRRSQKNSVASKTSRPIKP